VQSVTRRRARAYIGLAVQVCVVVLGLWVAITEGSWQFGFMAGVFLMALADDIGRLP
jgi:hypothetical protein